MRILTGTPLRRIWIFLSPRSRAFSDYSMKIRFVFIANGLIFSLIRDMIKNAKGGQSSGGKLQKTVPSYD